MLGLADSIIDGLEIGIRKRFLRAQLRGVAIALSDPLDTPIRQV
jgi:hypothetical protein